VSEICFEQPNRDIVVTNNKRIKLSENSISSYAYRDIFYIVGVDLCVHPLLHIFLLICIISF